MFTGNDVDEHEYEDWVIRIRDKLNDNADRFNEQTVTTYVITRIDEETVKLILFYRLHDFNYFKNLSMILDALYDIYANFERQKATRLTYKQIK